MVLCHMTSSLPWFLHVQAILSDHANLHGTINLQEVHAPRKLILNYSVTTCSFCRKNVSLKIEFMARTSDARHSFRPPQDVERNSVLFVFLYLQLYRRKKLQQQLRGK